jgi:lysine-specific demethylase 3
MYNAMASSEAPGSKGSTRLHMDMADAVNIMTYAADAPDGSPGCAAWDLFRAEDSDKLRKFLRKRFQGVFQHDPIHSQQVYLDSAARRELLKDYGVKSHRVYQRPGEAVFIPAGCAHQVCHHAYSYVYADASALQVCNLADCIKVAVDFVSPENIARCEKLTREFREQNQSMVWKEDVLQLRTMMWFAWLSCRRQESTD